MHRMRPRNASIATAIAVFSRAVLQEWHAAGSEPSVPGCAALGRSGARQPRRL